MSCISSNKDVDNMKRKRKNDDWIKAILFGTVFVILTIASDFFDQVWLHYGALCLIVASLCLLVFFSVIYYFGFKSNL